jgi:16S rRNA (cytosine967-C5)-methyltransferase
VLELVAAVVRHQRTLRCLAADSARGALKKLRVEASAAMDLGVLLVLRASEPGPEALAAELSKGLRKKGQERVARALDAVAARVRTRRERRAGDEDLADAGRALELPADLTVELDPAWEEITRRRPAARLGMLYSYPDALMDSWLDGFGPARTRSICRAGNEAPPLFARAHTLRADAAEVARRLADDGVGARLVGGDTPDALELTDGRGGFRKAAAFRDGLFVIQDLSAQRAARAVAPSPGERVLDLCAAPGGKTTYLAALMGNEGEVTAVDRKPRRLARVTETCERLGITCVRAVAGDGRDARLLAGERFDRVLVDGPCTNTGVLRRRPEARWAFTPRRLRRCVEDQRQLLRTAASLLRPGGTLVHSVCSIEPQETTDMARWLTETEPTLRLDADELSFPEPGGGDGGYWARFVRTG